jgi:hypothetical protein
MSCSRGVGFIGMLVLVACAVASCGGSGGKEATPAPAAISAQQALARLETTIAHVQTAHRPNDVGTSEYGYFVKALLEGHDFPVTPGLLQAQEALQRDSIDEFCSQTSEIVRNSLVNKTLSGVDRGIVMLTSRESRRHDPQALFLRKDDAVIDLMGSPARAEFVTLKPDIVPIVWKDDALQLIDLVYALGQECIEAARTAAG